MPRKTIRVGIANDRIVRVAPLPLPGSPLGRCADQVQLKAAYHREIPRGLLLAFAKLFAADAEKCDEAGQLNWTNGQTVPAGAWLLCPALEARELRRIGAAI